MCVKKIYQLFICLLLLSVLLSACNAQTGSKTLPTGKDATWNLVVIGDSSLWGMGKAMAKQIEEDMKVKVELFDASTAMSAGKVRAVLEGQDTSNYILGKLVEELKKAEYVIIFINPLDSIVKDKPLDLENCFHMKKAIACEPGQFANYISDMELIWKKIIQLRAGQATILRATDIYDPLVADWTKNGVFLECNACWENMSNAARQAAKNAGVPFLSQFDAYNGANHLEDPRLKGFIKDDGEHPTESANAMIAKLLAAMGYEPTIPK